MAERRIPVRPEPLAEAPAPSRPEGASPDNPTAAVTSTEVEDEESVEDSAGDSETISQSASDEEDDRWAGTMSGGWINEHGTPAASVTAHSRPKSPAPSLEEALGRIPPDALDLIRGEFKTDVKIIRPYTPDN